MQNVFVILYILSLFLQKECFFLFPKVILLLRELAGPCNLTLPLAEGALVVVLRQTTFTKFHNRSWSIPALHDSKSSMVAPVDCVVLLTSLHVLLIHPLIVDELLVDLVLLKKTIAGVETGSLAGVQKYTMGLDLVLRNSHLVPVVHDDRADAMAVARGSTLVLLDEVDVWVGNHTRVQLLGVPEGDLVTFVGHPVLDDDHLGSVGLCVLSKATFA